jgi:hypothetical protein
MIIELKGYVVDNASGFNLVCCLSKHIYIFMNGKNIMREKKERRKIDKNRYTDRKSSKESKKKNIQTE